MLDRLRAQAASENIRVTQHAQQEMAEEDILLDDILQAIALGQVLEDYPEHRRGACCLLNGVTDAGRPLHVVCTTARPGAYHHHGLRADAAEVAESHPESPMTMECSLDGCRGIYEEREVVHTVRHRGRVVVIDHVPAEVCSICSDVLFRPETVRRIEALLRTTAEPAGTVPLYEYA